MRGSNGIKGTPVRRLLEWYRRQGRSLLPWRTVRDPYRTLVSEFMLQQTQVDRVVPKFVAFVERFPDFEALARASPADVLRQWKGLGYNSRAVRLRRIAETVVERYGGRMPAQREELLALPGVGPYTAAAIRAFAFGLDDAPVDTNVRRILHRYFYGIEHPPAAGARELDERAHALLPPGRAYDWNSALMDLGSTICTTHAPACGACPLERGCVAAPIDSALLERRRRMHSKRRGPQSALPFERTTRYARGRIVDRLRDLPPGERISLLDLHRSIADSIAGRSLEEMRALLDALDAEGLVAHDGEHAALRE